MKFAPRQIAAAVLIAGTAFAATAQTPPPPQPGAPDQMQRGPGGPEMRMHERMHERGHDRMARRMGQLKEALRITPAQEPAWTAFTAAMRPGQKLRPDVGEMARLSTPERIDRMRQLRAQRNAEQDRRGDATKVFYGQLTAEQKRVFDQLTLRMHRGKGHGGRHGHHGGYRG